MFQPWRTCLCAIAIIALPWYMVAALENINPSQVFFSSRNVNARNDSATYLPDGLTESKNPRRITRKSTTSQSPDTTIVLLNWQRLQNVKLQVSVYCSPVLQGVVEQIFVWNNQPGINLTYEDHFATTGCSPERLRIFNSPSNLYFQARFMGCLDSHSRYCFLQDDDYITYSDILLNIHASFTRYEQQTLETPAPIILLPSHDQLETELMRITIPGIRPEERTIHTTFAWLGHGTFLLRSQVETYLGLLRRLNLTNEEMNLADNYFTLLSGQMPNVWFTHSIELDNKLPFTVGANGNERNWRHIERAMEYLHKILRLESAELSPHLLMPQSLPKLTASCIANPCTVHSNIQVLPPRLISSHAWSSGERLQDIQSRRIASLGEEGARWYIDNPIWNAVDGHVETAFRSAGTARAEEYISLTLLAGETTGSKNDKFSMDLASLVDANTATILYASELEISHDGVNWSPIEASRLTCFPTNFSLSADMRVTPPSILGLSVDREMQQRGGFDRTTPSVDLLECFTALELTEDRGSHVHVKIMLDRDFDFGWSIYEIWLRAS